MTHTKQWYDVIEKYNHHRANAEKILREKLARFDEEHCFENLKLLSVDLHDRPDVEFEWAFAYEVPSNGRIYTVLFAGDEPKTVTVDG